ncbi:hypothetical protein [Robiginitalea sp. SC105]|uniref:hypothetical protein n=1 Tax=Robiginitalea sp. SC105 TaxID=2762332 RepID=UPI00163A6DB1|nr:hypothetical protein [Robiginitalea sp. SC105]MBC2839260.1 hypothetical protein [Robiginitalea sp. SC105]
MSPCLKYTRHLLWASALLLCSGLNLSAQEKNQVRVSLNHIAEMPDFSAVELQARFRGENGFEPAEGLGFDLFCVYPNDSLVATGSAITDNMGKTVFVLQEPGACNRDSTGTYTYRAISLDHPDFKQVEREISFRRAILDIHIVEENDQHYVKATLTDEYSGEPVSENPVRISVSRLFRPLAIGGDFNLTDDSGSVMVPVPGDIPGVDGNLTFEARVSDHEDYGTVKSRFTAPLGVPVTDQSTFDERTMWSPPDKTPIFLLTIPNLLILGVWGTIAYLLINLYKISKSKNDLT